MFLLTDEQREMVSLAQSLARAHSSGPRVTWDEAAAYPWEFAAVAGEHGLTGIDLPDRVGGQGLGLLDAVLALESVASVHPRLGDVIQATNFGGIRQIASFGSEMMLSDVVQPALAGRALVSIAMSEPGAGSALASLRSRAVVEDGHVRVNGQKVFNTHGTHASHYVVWARFGDAKDDIGAVVIPDNASGFSRGSVERFASGEAFCSLYFDNVVVPTDNILVTERGIQQMMSIFNIERLGNATRSLAMGELALQLAVQHLVDREATDAPLAKHQGLRWKIADARMRLDAARLLIYRAATDLKDGVPDALNTAVAKCFANQAGFDVVNDALQIHGGYGFTEEAPFHYLLMRTRGLMIGGGTVEIQRNRIAAEVLNRAMAQSHLMAAT